MDSAMQDVSQEPQQNNQSEGHILVTERSLPIPHKAGEPEARPITTEAQLQQTSHQQQEQQHHDNPEALFHQQHQVEGNWKQQENSEEQIQEVIKPQNEEHSYEGHQLQKQCNQELQSQENKELHAEHNHQEVQAQSSQHLQSQQNQAVQLKEAQGHQNQQEIKTFHYKDQQAQVITTTTKVPQSHSIPGQHQEKQSIQNQSKKNQLSHKDLQQRQQEQHCKKLKKKLVGENQERINYLVQASRAVSLTAAVAGQRALAAQVGSMASAVGRRCVLRLAPALKRCLCKGCGTSLVYGLNARVRHRSRRQKHLVVTCLTCRTIKRFVSDPKHKLWFEQEEAVV